MQLGKIHIEHREYVIESTRRNQAAKRITREKYILFAVAADDYRLRIRCAADTYNEVVVPIGILVPVPARGATAGHGMPGKTFQFLPVLPADEIVR